MKVHVENPEDIMEKKADGRGRITLGSDFSGKKVQVAVLEVVDEE